MDGNRVITISRGYGSGGRTMGKMLAENLGWNYYDQELLRWSQVLGRRVLSAGSGARKLAKELEFSPEWDADEVLGKMHQLLSETFHRTLPDRPRAAVRSSKGLLRTLAGNLSRGLERRSDLLVLRKGSGSGDKKNSVHITHSFSRTGAAQAATADQVYIEETFGPCMYTDAEMRILERSRHTRCIEIKVSIFSLWLYLSFCFLFLFFTFWILETVLLQIRFLGFPFFLQ